MTFKRSIQFIAVCLFVGPAIFSVASALCVSLESLFILPITASPEKLAANFPRLLAAIAYLTVLAAIVGGVLASPITFAVGVTLALVDGCGLAGMASRQLKISRPIASDIMGFFVGAFAAFLSLVLTQDWQVVGGSGLASGVFTVSPRVSLQTVGILPISAFSGGISAAVCNRIAIAWGRRIASQPGPRVP